MEICASSMTRTANSRLKSFRRPLANIGDVSEPIKTKHGFAILKLTGQRRALTRTIAEVSQQIRAAVSRTAPADDG